MEFTENKNQYPSTEDKFFKLLRELENSEELIHVHCYQSLTSFGADGQVKIYKFKSDPSGDYFVLNGDSVYFSVMLSQIHSWEFVQGIYGNTSDLHVRLK